MNVTLFEFFSGITQELSTATMQGDEVCTSLPDYHLEFCIKGTFTPGENDRSNDIKYTLNNVIFTAPFSWVTANIIKIQPSCRFRFHFRLV